ncbi:MAG: response regulator [Magnetospirillum sp.]|nr:response regulator [Magnetospirillum sp.]
MADILVIDDDEMMIEIITDVMHDLGHSVRTAPHGQKGLDEAMRQTPNLVILDMNMPVMDGYTVAKRLRAVAATTGVPIIAVTGETTGSGYDAAYEAGCDAFVSKPLNCDQLIERVKSFVE